MPGRTKIGGKKIGLNITSMMDMFTIVLVFLLKNFATEGNLMTSADNLVLPVSKQADSPEEVSMNIVTDHDWILVDNEQIMKTQDAKKQDSLLLGPVSKILLEKRQDEQESQMTGVIDFTIGKIVLQFDKNLEYI